MSDTNHNSGSTSAEGKESFASLLGSWGQTLSKVIDEAEKFTKEKPSAGLATAFLAGLVLGSVLRRR